MATPFNHSIFRLIIVIMTGVYERSYYLLHISTLLFAYSLIISIMPRNKNKKRKAASPCNSSEDSSPVHKAKKSKQSANKNSKTGNDKSKLMSMCDAQPLFSRGSITVIGKCAHSMDRTTKNDTKYLRSVFVDKTGEIEFDSKKNYAQNQRVIENGDVFKLEFQSGQMKKQTNPRYNVGNSKYLVYDPTITQLTASEMRKHKNILGIHMNAVTIDEIKNQTESQRIDLIAKVIKDEIKTYKKYNRSWNSRRFLFGDCSGITGYFSDDLEFVVPENNIVVLKNAGLERNGAYVNIVGGYFLDETIINEYLSNEIENLIKNDALIQSGSFVFVEDEYIECGIRKYLQKRKEVYASNIEIDEKYLKIVLNVSVISLDNATECVYYSKTNDYKAIKERDLDGYDESELAQRFKCDMQFTDDSGRVLDILLWDTDSEELLGMSASEFAALTEKKHTKLVQGLMDTKCNLYICSKYETNDMGRKCLKSRVVKLITQ